MPSVNELKERRSKAVEAADAIQAQADMEGRALTPEEIDLQTKLVTESRTLMADIERREAVAAEKASLAKTTRQTPPQSPVSTEIPGGREYARPRRYGTLRAFKPQYGESGAQAEERAYRSGRWLAAVVYRHEPSRLWCQEHGMETRAMAEGSNTTGGILVPQEMESSIIDLKEDYGVFRAHTRVHPMASDNTLVPRRLSGVTVYFRSEAGAFTESTPTFDSIQLSTKNCSALIRVSRELNEDSLISMADHITNEIAYATAAKEDDCAFNGTGASAYGGITGILPKMVDGSHAASYYTAEGAGNSIDTFAEVTTTTLAGVMGQLPAYVYKRGQPKWFISPAGAALVFERLGQAAGGNTRDSLGSSSQMTHYAGFPIVRVPSYTGIGSTDFSSTIMLLFGDMSLATTLGDRRGVTIQVLTERYAEYGQIGIIGESRFDINVHDIGDGSTAGPLVGLHGN